MNKILRKRILNDLTVDCRVGWVKLRSNISKEHLMKQIEVAYELVRLGHEVVIEAKFKSGIRADILDLTTGKIVEICCSESIEEAKVKTKKYPDYLDIEFIQA